MLSSDGCASPQAALTSPKCADILVYVRIHPLKFVLNARLSAREKCVRNAHLLFWTFMQNRNPPAKPGVLHRRVKPFVTSSRVPSRKYDPPAARVLLLATRKRV